LSATPVDDEEGKKKAPVDEDEDEDEDELELEELELEDSSGGRLGLSSWMLYT